MNLAKAERHTSRPGTEVINERTNYLILNAPVTQVRTYLGIILLTLFVVGCAPQPIVDAESAAPGQDIVTVAQGTQYRRGNLRIGVVSVSENEAILAVIVDPTDPSQMQNNIVRETIAVGEETNAGGYRIKNRKTAPRIGGFMSGQSSGSVTLEITELDSLSASDAEVPTTPEQQACEAQGGKWGEHTLRATPSCALPTLDADKPCTDMNQCEGGCTADTDDIATARCSAWKPLSGGCQYYVYNGTVTFMCVD